MFLCNTGTFAWLQEQVASPQYPLPHIELHQEKNSIKGCPSPGL